MKKKKGKKGTKELQNCAQQCLLYVEKFFFHARDKQKKKSLMGFWLIFSCVCRYDDVEQQLKVI